jgi:hypothetical protein
VSRLLPAVVSGPDVDATVRALERELLGDPGHQLRPRNPGGVVRAGLRLSVAAAFRGLPAGRMPASHGIAPLADIPDGERRDRPPQLVIWRKHPVIAMQRVRQDLPASPPNRRDTAIISRLSIAMATRLQGSIPSIRSRGEMEFLSTVFRLPMSCRILAMQRVRGNDDSRPCRRPWCLRTDD